MNETISEIKKYVSELKIPGINQGLKMKIEEAYRLNQPYEELLKDIFVEAYDMRKENGRKNRIRNARFPYKKYLDELQVDYLPEDAKKRFKELKTLNFIEEGRNVILAGNPGTGKTHLSIGLGINACNKGYKVFFTTAATLINELKESRSEKKLYTFEKRFEKYDLIIIDELGYISFDKEGSELLFTFLSLRAERKSTIITTNLSFDRWNEIFNDAVLTAALIDRMTHKSYVINMNGDSYRIKETKEWLEKSN
ncbi:MULTISPECIES: IS21-like element helper ATPase IstB [Bacillota]|uniref:IS21-like element helper ATPase IstB n=3 Tax=cellular organisms TaxID=131567 RepID=A0A9Q4FMT8_9FIRM|nr:MULTISPECIES: IS21-like element helper ATPase IstB [Bacillota]MCB5559327.1 IS21-like element helper ATPase IstB [Anaerosalibacter bizertensis]MCG4566095.1 IS21-like element helper ATPase IstB [Anaerosalibacter bizertensis]MCG4572886.1 IS21-like element helper ATPase IstB [Clostridium cochlearium]MCG4581031.1 IS21-like element helper ATPase IstB [Clostridium cochlearium]MCG4583599.1 IS21-like element helper ATPase IstB [Anaerosalibacter bizertensis]